IKIKSFIGNFQLHRIMEDKSSIMVFISVLISIMIFMLGTNTHYLTTNNYDIAKEGLPYNYLCTMKSSIQGLDTEGERAYIQEAKAKKYGINIRFSVIGIEEDSKFYDFDLNQENDLNSLNAGEAIASQALSSKLGLKIGDEFTFTEGLDKQEHIIKIVDIVKSNANLELYMNIDQAREEFDKDKDYYTTLLFDDEPDIDSYYIYSTIKAEDVLGSFEVMEDTMTPFMNLTYISSVLIYISTMYLIVSTMIDRSVSGISLTKLLGFNSWEIQRMYVNPIIYAVVVALAVAIPVAKLLCDLISPSIYKDLLMGMFFEFSWQSYMWIFITAVAIFFIILLVLVIKVKKISVNEILKNRE
ncbi:MAG: hypothetical protein Q4E99_01350, partial [Bacillota bacterium]|nr:hypothetical protein [Bacillota bacterium]